MPRRTSHGVGWGASHVLQLKVPNVFLQAKAIIRHTGIVTTHYGVKTALHATVDAFTFS